MKPKAIILDFDGTIADYRKREHIRDIDFSEYIKLSYTDIPFKAVCEIIRLFKNEYKIIILSARAESARQETIDWLSRFNIHFDKLILKQDSDTRDDGYIKYEILNESLMTEYDILFCIDDRSTCISYMRQLGLPAFQCGEGY